MSKSRTSPRKFSEKIALLNKSEADTTAEFEKIIQEVGATTRAPSSPRYLSNTTPIGQNFSWIEDTNVNDNLTYYDGYQNSNQQIQQQFQHYQQHQPPVLPSPSHQQLQQQNYHQQHSTSSTHMGLVPNIEISHINDDSSYYHHQQVNNNIAPIDRSSFMSAARSLPDIANLRVSSPGDAGCNLSSSCSDYRLRSNTIGNNSSLGDYNTMQSNNQSQDASYLWSQQQQPDPCFQHQQQPVIMMDNHPSLGTYNEYHHPPQQQTHQGSVVRASSSDAVMADWSNNNALYAPKMNHLLSRSSDDTYHTLG